jgi:lipoprotein signal peptidase
MFILCFLSVLVLDQLTKVYFSSISQTVLNRGVSFSWLGTVSAPMVLAIIVVVATILAVSFRQDWVKYPVPSALFWGGAASNIVDRLLVGGVVDWLHIPGVLFTNNLADVAIGAGLLGLLIMTIKDTYDIRHTV